MASLGVANSPCGNEMKIYTHKEALYKNVHRSIIYNSGKLETIKIHQEASG